MPITEAVCAVLDGALTPSEALLALLAREPKVEVTLPDALEMRAICVFCGSQPGRREEYVAAARDTARRLRKAGVELVYGGGHVGLMGALADEALKHGARVVGVIPQHLMRPEVAHQGLTELIVVDSMHTRKQTMALRSDAFIVLPGGFGTIEEMFEMLTWLQLRLQDKPVGLLNVAGLL